MGYLSPTTSAKDVFLPQFEVENAALRETNKQQEAQIGELQKKMDGRYETQGYPFICEKMPHYCIGRFSEFEQKCSGKRAARGKSGEAHRVSSLTFGCFQVRGESAQVLTGPVPSQRSLSVEEETEGRVNIGKNALYKETSAMDKAEVGMSV